MLRELVMRRGIGMQACAVAVSGLLVALAVWKGAHSITPEEPQYGGLRLSEWIDAVENNNRFEPGSGRQSPFSYETIDMALAEMRPAALPTLLRWIKTEPSWIKPQLNRLLQMQPWLRFRFKDACTDLQILAISGIAAYGTDAQPLLPELLRLTTSQDPSMRLSGFEGAFFTYPDRETFLPLVRQALRESDKSTQEMAACWMVKRFPVEAEIAGLRSRYPHFYEDEPADEPKK